MIPRCRQVAFTPTGFRPCCTDTGDLENNILSSRIDISARTPAMALLPWPRAPADTVQPGLALSFRVPGPSVWRLLTCRCSAAVLPPPHDAVPGEEVPFHEGLCAAAVTAFIFCVHSCHAPFWESVLLLLFLQCYLTVLNNCTPSHDIIWACHSNGILS